MPKKSDSNPPPEKNPWQDRLEELDRWCVTDWLDTAELQLAGGDCDADE